MPPAPVKQQVSAISPYWRRIVGDKYHTPRSVTLGPAFFLMFRRRGVTPLDEDGSTPVTKNRHALHTQPFHGGPENHPRGGPTLRSLFGMAEPPIVRPARQLEVEPANSGQQLSKNQGNRGPALNAAQAAAASH